MHSATTYHLQTPHLVLLLMYFFPGTLTFHNTTTVQLQGTWYVGAHGCNKISDDATLEQGYPDCSTFSCNNARFPVGHLDAELE